MHRNYDNGLEINTRKDDPTQATYLDDNKPSWEWLYGREERRGNGRGWKGKWEYK